MSNVWLRRKNLEQIKAELQRLSEQHALTRPERRAHHPFVWNSLKPYRDTAEIEHLIAMVRDAGFGTRSSGRCRRDRKASGRTVQLSH